MSQQLKFEFNFDEVFEGIKLGVVKELSEMTFDNITSSAINQVKTEMKNKISLTYKDEYEIRNEIKKEIKEKVYQKLLIEIKADYKKQYEDAFGKDIINAFDKVEEEIIEDIKSDTIERLCSNLYSDIRNQVKTKINASVSEIINGITGNSIKVKDTQNTITKEEYDKLVHRDRILYALECGGVDNWEGYGYSLSEHLHE